jgi:type IV pilus assembly protein PilB
VLSAAQQRGADRRATGRDWHQPTVNATLAGVLAQRLVRRNCEHCKAPEQVPADMRDALHVGAAETFWHGNGCEECSGTGYRGRIAVYELLEMSPELRNLVRTGAGHDQIEAQAIEGMVSPPRR